MRGFALTSVGAPAGPPAQGEEEGPTQSRGQDPSLARSLLLWGAGVTVTSAPQQAGPVQLPSLLAGGINGAVSTSHPQGSGRSRKKRGSKPKQAIEVCKHTSQVAEACAPKCPPPSITVESPTEQRLNKKHTMDYSAPLNAAASLNNEFSGPPPKKKRTNEKSKPVHQPDRFGLARRGTSTERTQDEYTDKALEVLIKKWEEILGDPVEDSATRCGPSLPSKSSDTTAQMYWRYERGDAPVSASDTANFFRDLNHACIAAQGHKETLVEGRKQSNEMIRRAWLQKGVIELPSREFADFESFRPRLDFLVDHLEAGLWRPSPLTCKLLAKFGQPRREVEEEGFASEYLADFRQLLDRAQKSDDPKSMQELQKALDDLYCLRWTTIVEEKGSPPRPIALTRVCVDKKKTPPIKLVLDTSGLRRVTQCIILGNKALCFYFLLAFSGKPERKLLKDLYKARTPTYPSSKRGRKSSAKEPLRPPPTPTDPWTSKSFSSKERHCVRVLENSHIIIRALCLVPEGQLPKQIEHDLRGDAQTRLKYLEQCVQAGTWTASPPISLLVESLSAAESEDAIAAAKTVYLREFESARASALEKGEGDREAMGKFLNMLDDFCCLILALGSDRGDLVIFRRPSRVEEPAQPLCVQINHSALVTNLYDIMISDPVLKRYLKMAFHERSEYGWLGAAKPTPKRDPAFQTSRCGIFTGPASGTVPLSSHTSLTPAAALTSFAQKLDGVKLKEVGDPLAQKYFLEGLKAIFTGGTLADQHALFAGLLSLKEKALSTKSEAITLKFPQRERFTKEGISTIAANIHIETLKEVLGRLEAEVPWVKENPSWNMNDIHRINEEAPIYTETPPSEYARDANTRKCTDNGERKGASSDGSSTNAYEKDIEHVRVPGGSGKEYAPSSSVLSDGTQLETIVEDDSSLGMAQWDKNVVHEAKKVECVDLQELPDGGGSWEERIDKQAKSWPWPSPRSSPNPFHFDDLY